MEIIFNFQCLTLYNLGPLHIEQQPLLIAVDAKMGTKPISQCSTCVNTSVNAWLGVGHIIIDDNGAHLSVRDGSTTVDVWYEYAFRHTNKLLVKLHFIEGQCLGNTDGEAFI